MNWRDAEGRLPEYWVEHFRQLGAEVPEGVPGTNPTDMARSPLLKKLQPPQRTATMQHNPTTH